MVYIIYVVPYFIHVQWGIGLTEVSLTRISRHYVMYVLIVQCGPCYTNEKNQS